jgi:hypothetical protein
MTDASDALKLREKKMFGQEEVIKVTIYDTRGQQLSHNQ